ncbi:MAG: type II toxin-antitoxin system HipA family toxin [Gammaproteobacteria bacterium]|nr:type II toxin-antitoxin system HipA family toxin [Gammaproteobacteria bacterium]
MTSNNAQEAFVWIWLPHETQPVVAGKLAMANNKLIFNYGKTYLQRENAIAIYDVELPLRQGDLPLLSGLSMPGCIRDGSPDAWGRRVLINRLLGLKGIGQDPAILDELTYLLESGSDRIGALDFQRSATNYEPRLQANVSLSELQDAAEQVEKGEPLLKELDQALYHGSSIGGARPKALIEENGKKYIAKFSSSSDVFSILKAEFIAMQLAKMAGLNVANVLLTKSAHKDVLLIERFDRVPTGDGWERKSMISALTLLGLDEMMARYASYQDLAEIIRHQFYHAATTLKELFSRLTFNILTGNTDDHARNHAAFWDGKMLTLTPAYDICPQNRTGREASQAMFISDNNRMSNISSCLSAAPHFLLSKTEANAIIEAQIICINENWSLVCDMAHLNKTDRAFLWGRQFLNPYVFENPD